MSCTYKKQGGELCQAKAIKGQEHCFFHSSTAENKRKAAQSNGGKANSVVVKHPLPPVRITEVNDVVRLLEDTVNRVRSGEIDVRVGNCIGVLSGHLIKALEVASISNRVEIIERAILERKTRVY